MKYLPVLLALLFHPAHAETLQCFPTTKIIGTLLSEEFVPVAELALGDVPAEIFVSPSHQYIILERKDENTACIIGGGVAFYLLRERKA